MGITTVGYAVEAGNNDADTAEMASINIEDEHKPHRVMVMF